MRKREVARKQMKVAEVRETQARAHVARQQRAVAEQERLVSDLDRELEVRERELASSGQMVGAAWLGVVDTSRQVITYHRAVAEQDLTLHRMQLEERRVAHLERFQARQAAERVMERLNDTFRRELDARAQRELDDFSIYRYSSV